MTHDARRQRPGQSRARQLADTRQRTPDDVDDRPEDRVLEDLLDRRPDRPERAAEGAADRFEQLGEEEPRRIGERQRVVEDVVPVGSGQRKAQKQQSNYAVFGIPAATPYSS